MNRTDYDYKLVIHYRLRSGPSRRMRASYPLYHGINEKEARLDLLSIYVADGYRVLKIEKKERKQKS